MLKYLRIAVATLSLASALLLVLWSRSYTWGDNFIVPLTSAQRLGFTSWQGWLTVRWDDVGQMDPQSFRGWTLRSHAIVHTETERYQTLAAQGITINRPSPGFGFHARYFQVPHWLVVFLTAALGAILGIRRPDRPNFSLRTLLIATTLVAVVLGIAIAAK